MSALYKTGTVAWIRIAEASEWILAYARDYTWVYLLAGTTRLGNGSISPLTAPSDIQIVHLPEHAEPEDTDDLYVEPEPLHEGQWVQVWAQVRDPEPDPDGDFRLHIRRLQTEGTSYTNAYAHPDAIVRPAAGQVPPWVRPVEEPIGLGAVVEAEVLSLGGHDYVRTATDSDFPWTRAGENYMANAYSWADLKNPKVITPGWTKGGAS